MATWTVSATWTKQGNGLAWNVLATFTKDGVEFAKDVPFNGILSADNARRTFGNQIAQYEAADFSPQNGAFDMTTPAPPEPIPPTDEELKAAAASQARAKLIAAKQDLETGLIAQADFDAALAAAKKAASDAATAAQAAVVDAQV